MPPLSEYRRGRLDWAGVGKPAREDRGELHQDNRRETNAY